MNRLRNRLILAFLAATLAPLCLTLWWTTRLLQYSLKLAPTAELEKLSRSLEQTGREFYQRAGDDLKSDALAGKLRPVRYSGLQRQSWPDSVEEFFESGEAERFMPAGREGERLEYYVRRNADVWVWSTKLGGVALDRLSRQIAEARKMVSDRRDLLDLPRGFTYTYAIVAAAIWLAAFGVLVYMADRVSRPIQDLTAGLSKLASGDMQARVEVRRDDEVGRAGQAFNYLAGHLKQSTDRLVHLTQLASWQMLARKMAHEVKNSLTPIRLTVEEMLARHGEGDRAFMEQAAQIVVEEVESLERRIRAFSQFATEPPVRPAPLDLNALLEERVAFLKTAHPEIAYSVRLAGTAMAWADGDLVKGILTNLLENAAQAAGEGGHILGVTAVEDGKVAVEVHDSGPGLSEQVRASLFQPTISFKKGGMGLGLSIARKSALLSGGDIVTVKGELGGAAFRVLLPGEHAQTSADRG